MALPVALWLFAACLIATGCSKEPVQGPDGGDPVAVRFTVEGLSEMLSATQATSGTKGALTENTTVRVIAYRNGSSPAQDSYVTEMAYVWNGSNLISCTVDNDGANPQLIDENMQVCEGNYDFYAITPALPLGDDKVTLTTAVDNAMDYAASVTSAMITDQTSTLTLNELKHQCARVSVVVTKAPNSDISTFKANSLLIRGLADAQSVTVGTPLAPATSGSQIQRLGDTEFSGNGSTFTSSNICVLPVDNMDLTLAIGCLVNEKVNVVIDSEPLTVTLEAGKSYTITASVFYDQSGTIEPNMEISVSTGSWTPENDNNPNFEYKDAYPYLIASERVVVLRDSWGMIKGYRFHGYQTETILHREAAPPVGNAYTEPSFNASGMNTVPTRMKVSEIVGTGGSRMNKMPACIDMCKNYSEEGYPSGWRIPTVAEAHFIVSVNNDNNVLGIAHATALASCTLTRALNPSAPEDYCMGKYVNSNSQKMQSISCSKCVLVCVHDL